MDSQPTATSTSFEEGGADTSFNCYKIKFTGQQKPDDSISVTLTQKNYNKDDATWFSLTLCSHFTGIPDGELLFFNYIDSVVSQDETVVLNIKGPFRFKEQFLIVDGIWKAEKTVEPYSITIESTVPAQIEPHIDNDRPHTKKSTILSDSIASRCMFGQPTRNITLEKYGDLRNTYKIIDYGNPKLSLYGILIIVAHGKTEIIESLEFENLKDFRIVGEEIATTTITNKLHIKNKRILLKRTSMSDETFSFKSEWKTGKEVKMLPGGAGDWGDHNNKFLSDEEYLIVKPPIQKQVKGATKESKGATKEFKGATKEFKGATKEGNLSLPKGAVKGRKTSGSPNRLASPSAGKRSVSKGSNQSKESRGSSAQRKVKR